MLSACDVPSVIVLFVRIFRLHNVSHIQILFQPQTCSIHCNISESGLYKSNQVWAIIPFSMNFINRFETWSTTQSRIKPTWLQLPVILRQLLKHGYFPCSKVHRVQYYQILRMCENPVLWRTDCGYQWKRDFRSGDYSLKYSLLRCFRLKAIFIQTHTV